MGGDRAGIIASQAAKGSAASAALRRAQAAKHAADIMPSIEAAKAAGAVSLREIAEYLNEHGEEAPKGGNWSATQVNRVLSLT